MCVWEGVCACVGALCACVGVPARAGVCACRMCACGGVRVCMCVRMCGCVLACGVCVWGLTVIVSACLSSGFCTDLSSICCSFVSFTERWFCLSLRQPHSSAMSAVSPYLLFLSTQGIQGVVCVRVGEVCVRVGEGGALVLPLISTASFISDVCSVSLSPLPLHPGDPGCGVRACGGGVRACGGRGSVGSASHFDSLIHQRCLQCLFSSSPPGDPGCGVRASGGRCACVWGVVC